MSESIYIACDFSGIQDYVLAVKSAGGAQAKRLRARSFLLELFEYAALAEVKNRLSASDEDILVQGGGGFLARVGGGTDPQAIEEINADLQRKLWEETRGGVQASLVSGKDVADARARLERRKRRPAFSVLQSEGAWSEDNLSLPPLGDPCEICGQDAGRHSIEEDGGAGALHCGGCLKTRELGERLARWDWMRVGAPGSVQAMGADFSAVPERTPDSFRAGRWIPRDDKNEPLDFAAIANMASGDKRLAALKADVDDMGVRVNETASADPTCARLRAFSRSLHAFFSETVQDMLEKSWRSIYTIYAGGDDLLLIGPWDAALDFAGALADAFENGPAREFADAFDKESGREFTPLTVSAGVAPFPYRLPVRHAVERAETLLETAKSQDGKNSCAALESVWTWENHQLVIGDGKRLARWTRGLDGLSRSLLHRLLLLAESDDPARAARWAYQTGRNVRRRRNSAGFHGWATNAMHSLEDDPRRVDEIAASIRYALIATRV